MIKLVISFNDADKTVVKASGHSLGMAVGNIVRKLLVEQETVFDDGEVLFGLSEVVRTEQTYDFVCEEMPENNFSVTISGEMTRADAPAPVVVTEAAGATPPPASETEETPIPVPAVALEKELVAA